MATFLKPTSNNPDSGTQYLGYYDDDYLAEIAQYKDKSWYSQLLNNPWLAGNQKQFSPTFWQGIAEMFGDTSSRDSYNAQLASNRSQWLSEFLERMRQEEYNAPTAQVERETAAGLNPALNPHSISSGDAAENDQPISPLTMPTSSVAESIGQMGMQFFNQIIGLAQSFQSLQLGNSDLISREISNNESARDFVLNQIAGTSFFNNEHDLDNMSPGDLANNIIAASAKIDYSPYSPRTRKLIRSMFGRYAKDVSSGRSPMAVEDLKSQLRSRIASNNSSAARTAGSPLFDEDFNEFLRKCASTISKGEYEAEIAEFKSRASKAGYDSRYFHHLDPEKQAKAENDAAEATSTTSKQTAITESVWNDLYEICKGENTWYGTLGLILIPFLRSMVSNMSFGLGRYGKSGKFGFTGINF